MKSKLAATAMLCALSAISAQAQNIPATEVSYEEAYKMGVVPELAQRSVKVFSGTIEALENAANANAGNEKPLDISICAGSDGMLASVLFEDTAIENAAYEMDAVPKPKKRSVKFFTEKNAESLETAINGHVSETGGRIAAISVCATGNAVVAGTVFEDTALQLADSKLGFGTKPKMKYVRIFGGNANDVAKASAICAKEKGLRPVNVLTYEANGAAYTCVVFEELL